MKWKAFALISCFLFTLKCFAQTGYGIDVELQSSKIVQIEPGHIITSSFLITNYSSVTDSFIPVLKKPEDWKTIPAELLPFTLSSQGQTFEIVAVRIPNNTPPGNYHIEYIVQGTDQPTLLGRDNFSVQVLPVRKITSHVMGAQKNISAGEKYSFKVDVYNEGNVATDVALDIKNLHDLPIEVSPASNFALEPHGMETVTITVQTDKNIRNPFRNIVSVHARPADEIEPHSTKTVIVHVLPKANSYHYDVYRTIPIKTTIVAAKKVWEERSLCRDARFWLHRRS